MDFADCCQWARVLTSDSRHPPVKGEGERGGGGGGWLSPLEEQTGWSLVCALCSSHTFCPACRSGRATFSLARHWGCLYFHLGFLLRSKVRERVFARSSRGLFLCVFFCVVGINKHCLVSGWEGLGWLLIREEMFAFATKVM